MLSITHRVKRRYFGYKIVHPFFLKERWGRLSEPLYETPLIEIIIRKGISRISRERVKIQDGRYSYKPSQSYFNYVSKVIKLRKQK